MVKVKLEVINSFRPVHVSSLDCSLFFLLPLFSGKEKLISIFAAIAEQGTLQACSVCEFQSVCAWKWEGEDF